MKQKIRSLLKFCFLKLLLPAVYRISTLFSGKKDILFLRLHLLKGADNFAALQQKLTENGQPYTTLCLEVGSYYINCLRLAVKAAGCQFIFVDDSVNALLCLPLSEKTHVVQLWHACGAFKKWGYASAEQEFGENRKTLKRYYPHHKYRLVCVSAPFVVPFYEAAFGLEGLGIVQPLGTPRTDAYFKPDLAASARAELESAFPEAAGKKWLLLAPTFRGEIENAVAPKLPDLTLLGSILGPDWHIFIKQHPAVRNKPSFEGAKQISEVSGLSMDLLLPAVDVAVTDYSSWIFEYALLGKPLFFFADDLSEYEDDRGFFQPYRSIIPGNFFTETQALGQAILQSQQNFDPSALEAFRQTYMSACDGKATERILAWMKAQATT